MISAQDIEKKRTAKQLELFVKFVFEKVEENSGELQKAKRKRGLYRTFVNEVIPLSKFAHLLYPANTSFRPVLGNQGFDVEVFDSSGKLVDKLKLQTLTMVMMKYMTTVWLKNVVLDRFVFAISADSWKV